MKTKLSILLVLMVIVNFSFSQVDSIMINYYENYPFAYKEGGRLRGIEIEIVEEFVSWLKLKKNITVYPKYTAFSEFSVFYNSIKRGDQRVVGLGSVADNADRRKEVVFSPPYLENTAVLITDGTVPTIRERDPAEVATVLSGMKAIVVSKSNHVSYINELKKIYDQTQLEVPDMQIVFTEKETDVLQKISSDKLFFGYVDIIAYWSFVKGNPSKFLKMQKVLNEPKEFLGFIMPKTSVYGQYFNEFFEGGFGFTATKIYHQILEKHLGYEIIESVEIK